MRDIVRDIVRLKKCRGLWANYKWGGVTFLRNTSSQNSLQMNFIKSRGSVEVNFWLATIFSAYLSFIKSARDKRKHNGYDLAWSCPLDVPKKLLPVAYIIAQNIESMNVYIIFIGCWICRKVCGLAEYFSKQEFKRGFRYFYIWDCWRIRWHGRLTHS